MATISQVLRNVNKLDLYSASMKVVKKDEEPILNLNKKQLFSDGENNKSKKLKRYRNGMYELEKHERNPAPGLGIPDLFNTGKFYKKFKIKILSKKEYEMFSTDDKAIALQKKYGKDIFGLSENSRNEMVEKFFERDLMKEIKQIIKL
jgi:hypothetical protein